MKYFSKFLFILTACLIGFSNMQAQSSGNCGAEGNETSVQWAFSPLDGKLTISGNGPMTNFTNSAGVNPIPWLTYRQDITTVDIGEGVTTVGDRAINNGLHITSVSIASSVTNIGYATFSNLPELISFTCRSEEPPALGEWAFADCPLSTATLYVPVGSIQAYTDSLGWKDFGTILNLEGASEDPVLSGNCGAAGNETNVHWAFSPSDKKLTITGTGAMADFPTGSTPWHQFGDNVKTVDIRDGVTTIGSYAFQNLFGIKSLIIAASVTNINFGALYNCRYLTSVTCLGAAPPSIDSNAFLYVPLSGNTLHVPVGSIQAYTDALVWGDFGTILNSKGASEDPVLSGTCGGEGNETNVHWAFSPSDGTLTISGNGAMADYNPYAVLPAPWYSFSGDMTTVNIEEGVTTVGECAFFHYYDITSVSIAASVTNIKYSAFDGCSGLTSVTCLSVGPPDLGYGDWVFTGISPTATLYVPVGSIRAYTESSWSEYFTNILNLNGDSEDPVVVTSIILDQSSVTLAVGATTTLTAIEHGNATHQAVSWHSSNPAVADTLSTDGLTAVVIAKAAGEAWIIATTIDGNHADSCLVTVQAEGTCGVNLRWTLQDSVLTVSGSGAMEDYETNSAPWYAHQNAIKSVVVEGEVTHIGSCAFYAPYSNLTSVTIGDSVKSIGNYAFGLCSALTSVTNLRLSPQTIDAKVFDDVDLSGIMLYVPAGGSRRSYLKAAVWKNFKKVQRVGITEPNSDATLSDLVVSSNDQEFGIVPQFSSERTYYTLSVASSVSSVTIAATPNDPEAIIVSGDGAWQLTTGNNILEVMVEAENEDLKTYKIAVTRELNTDIPSVAEPVEAVEAGEVQVYLHRQNLYIDSPEAERIAVYSITGALLCNFEKPVGKASFAVASTASTGSAAGFASTGSAARMLIVKGSSGWVRKLVSGN
jgi:uncharacterized protein YjdB